MEGIATLRWRRQNGILRKKSFRTKKKVYPIISYYQWTDYSKYGEVNDMEKRPERIKQLTVTWHVDDLETSHVDPQVLCNLVDQLTLQYWKVNILTETRGQVHNYLGMVSDITNPGKTVFGMTCSSGNVIDLARANLLSGGEYRYIKKCTHV